MQINKNIYLYGGGAVMTAAPIYIADAYNAVIPYVFWIGLMAIISATILNIRDYCVQSGFKVPDCILGSKYLSLDQALRTAWERLEGTSFINGLQCLDLGERYGDNRMYWLWREFADKDKFDIKFYGAREPSSNVRLIDKNDLSLDTKDTYEFQGNRLKARRSNHYFNNVKILKSDLKNFIKEYKNDQ